MLNQKPLGSREAVAKFEFQKSATEEKIQWTESEKFETIIKFSKITVEYIKTFAYWNGFVAVFRTLKPDLRKYKTANKEGG